MNFRCVALHTYSCILSSRCRVRESYVLISRILYVGCDNLLCIFAVLRCVYILAFYILLGCENHMYLHPVFHMWGAIICCVFSLFCVAYIFSHSMFYMQGMRIMYSCILYSMCRVREFAVNLAVMRCTYLLTSYFLWHYACVVVCHDVYSDILYREDDLLTSYLLSNVLRCTNLLTSYTFSSARRVCCSVS